VTGQPDFASLRINYRPRGKCIESKSLKLYLFSFRNYRGFAEEIANRICSDLSGAADPEEMTVDMSFTARGGVKLRVKSSYNRRQEK
jgi:7-cyano-7-deazaguanine reductase